MRNLRLHWKAIASSRNTRTDHNLIQQIREARIRQGSELVTINGRARFIDPAKVTIERNELAA